MGAGCFQGAGDSFIAGALDYRLSPPCLRRPTSAGYPFSFMHWPTWTPRERAVLCFIVKDGSILLIRKKRGLGAGKINGPGGRIEPGETPREAVVRETREEIGVTPLGIEERGELQFQFTDGYSLHCIVFQARDLEGDLIETDEADPFWCAVDEIPYDGMWQDDRYWLPLMLEAKPFLASFEFDGEQMLSKEIEIREEFIRP